MYTNIHILIYSKSNSKNENYAQERKRGREQAAIKEICI